MTFSKGSPAGEVTAVAGAKPHSPLGERKQHLLMAVGCQKCFCVTLDKSNRTPAAAGKREEVSFYEENDQC